MTDISMYKVESCGIILELVKTEQIYLYIK